MRLLMIILHDMSGNKTISWQAIKTAYQYAKRRVRSGKSDKRSQASTEGVSRKENHAEHAQGQDRQ